MPLGSWLASKLGVTITVSLRGQRHVRSLRQIIFPAAGRTFHGGPQSSLQRFSSNRACAIRRCRFRIRPRYTPCHLHAFSDIAQVGPACSQRVGVGRHVAVRVVIISDDESGAHCLTVCQNSTRLLREGNPAYSRRTGIHYRHTRHDRRRHCATSRGPTQFRATKSHWFYPHFGRIGHNDSRRLGNIREVQVNLLQGRM
jgi:hypothetical protein